MPLEPRNNSLGGLPMPVRHSVPRFHPRLRAGEMVRLAPEGPVYRVARVSPGAAYLRAVYAEPRRVELPDGRTFLARQGGDLLAVSPNAAVYRSGQGWAPWGS